MYMNQNKLTVAKVRSLTLCAHYPHIHIYVQKLNNSIKHQPQNTIKLTIPIKHSCSYCSHKHRNNLTANVIPHKSHKSQNYRKEKIFLRFVLLEFSFNLR